MYLFKDELTDTFFRFNKWLVRDQIWARLPLASKAIYPVIGVHTNEHGWAFPSEQTIAILSGISENTVRKGIHGLLEVPGFEVEKYVTTRGYKANRYFINPPPKRKDTSFFFHKLVVTGGNWMKLRSTAKAKKSSQKKSLDYLPHALQVLDEIVEAVGDNTVLIADGGFRRGSDIIKGLAFGASLVGLGRPILYGLAAQGREGVYSLINEITEEMKRIMSLIGAEYPGKLHRSMLIEDP